MFGNFQRRVTEWFGQLKINAGTTKAPALEVAQTWNTTDHPTAVKLNITKVAAGASAKFLDIQYGGYSRIALMPNTYGITLDAGTNEFSLKSRTILLRDENGNEVLGIAIGNAPYSGIFTNKSLGFGWSESTGISSQSCDLYLTRDAAHTLSQKYGTNPQESRLYGSYTSATAYQRLSTKTIREAVTCAAGASVTTTISIPKFTHLIGVTTRVTTAVGTTNSTTGYQVGDGTDADLWGAITGTAQGTTSDRRDFTAVDALGPDGADRTITLTAVGGNFDGTGVIEVCAYYLAAEAD